jgi:hypothetical protein
VDVTVDTPRLGPVLLQLSRADKLTLPAIPSPGEQTPAATAPR